MHAVAVVVALVLVGVWLEADTLILRDGRPIPSRPGAALIGRIGEDPFFIGDGGGPVRMRQSGRLYLGINDDYLADNSGHFRVTVYH